MNIYETKERIEKFLEKEIDVLVPDQFAGIFHEMLDKIEEKLNFPKEVTPDVNESTDAEPTTVDEPIYESSTTESKSVIPAGTDGTTTTSGTEPIPK